MIGNPQITNIGRGLMRVCQPLTGDCAMGEVTLQAKPGKTFQLKRNSFLMPILNGERRQDLVFKVLAGPNEDESWTITEAGVSVQVASNIGGLAHNVIANTPFSFDVSPDELVTSGVGIPYATANFEGATAPPAHCGVNSMAIFESFDGPVRMLDLQRSPLKKMPAVMLTFMDFQPADGSTIAQTNQETRVGSTGTLFKVTYMILVIVSKMAEDHQRRQEGLFIAEGIMQLITQRKSDGDGVCISNPGGVQVRQMMRLRGNQPIFQKHYVYSIVASAEVLLDQIDDRCFHPWLRTAMNVDKPQSPALPEQGAFRLVDNNVIDMTPGQLDFAIDGTYTGGPGFLWLDEPPLELYPVNTRRQLGVESCSEPGLLMEPAVTNEAATAAVDGWTTVNGATVTPNSEDNPTGTATDATLVTFAADADSAIEQSGFSCVSGEPVTFSVFIKSPGILTTSQLRLEVTEDAGPVVHTSDPVSVGPVWTRLSFAFTPQVGGGLTLRIKSADATARAAVAWGPMYSDATARWLTEYVAPGTPHGADRLVFLAPNVLPPPSVKEDLRTPQALQTGKWKLTFTPAAVHPQLQGTAVTPGGNVLLSVGNGATELVTLTLVGTPATGGAELTVEIPRTGASLQVSGIEWEAGALLGLTVDANLGALQVEGTLNVDGEYSFDPYDVDAVAADFLTIGGRSDGSGEPSPGAYHSVEVL